MNVDGHGSSSSMRARVLLVDAADADERSRQALTHALERHGHHVRALSAVDEAFALVMDGEVDVVVTDLGARSTSGVELRERIVVNRPDLPVIVLAGSPSLETALTTLRAGAFDVLPRPVDPDALVLAVERANRTRCWREGVKRLPPPSLPPPSSRHDDLPLGQSAAMRQVRALIERIASAEASLLVTGETGTGKELVARAIHQRGRRQNGPLVAINCGALPEQLLESELFGHARGAFTDARDKRVGLFMLATGGTLFLDEVGEMPPPMQVKLLRALETRRVRPVGSNQEIAFDVRVVAATNRDLEHSVRQGRFREDLLYRLNVIQVCIPPLRERGDDVLTLAQHFLERFATRSDKCVRGFSAAVADKLTGYAWPGNVRELQNSMERAVALAQHEHVVVEDLPEKMRQYRSSRPPPAPPALDDLVPMEEVQRRYALRVLEAVGGNKNMATRILGWDRKTLYRRLQSWSGGSKGD